MFCENPKDKELMYHSIITDMTMLIEAYKAGMNERQAVEPTLRIISEKLNEYFEEKKIKYPMIKK